MTPAVVVELSLVNAPSKVVGFGPVAVAPMVGDFVKLSKPDWAGYVGRRKLSYLPNGDCVVRCWLQAEEPRR